MELIRVYLLEPTDQTPYYYAQWLLPGTTRRKTRSLKTGDPGAAEDARAVLEYRLNHEAQQAAPRQVSWDDFVARYEREKLVDRKAYTRQKVLSILTAFGRLARPRGLAWVSEDMLAQYSGHLREERRKPVTINTHLAHIRAALRWAVRHKLLGQAPHVEALKVPRKQKIRTIGAEAFARLLQALPSDEWRLYARVAWYAGMRNGEMHLLRWAPWEDDPYLDLGASRVRFPAETNKAGSDQSVPVHPDLHAELLPQRKEAGRVFALSASKAEVSRGFARICRRLGFAITAHDLRRSFGTRYAALVPAQVLQRLMRHADIRTTLEYYADLDGALDEAIRKA